MSTRVCGTGDWSGPRPGDPDTRGLSLWAVPSFGGIDVRWTYPSINGHAVAHVELFRSTIAGAVPTAVHEIVSGTRYHDEIGLEEPQEFFYWIRVISVNGTRGDLIGPARAMYEPTIEGIMRRLTNRINEGVLAQSLRKTIDQIQLNKLGITQEMIDRAASDDALAVALNELYAFNEDTQALIQQEAIARAEADDAFVSTVNTLYATLEDTTAAVQQERLARISADEALAASIQTAQSQLAGNIASVQTTLQTRINRVDGRVTGIGALYTAKVDVDGLVGGFGVYNDGREIEAGFDVDTFWIGSSNRNKVKPFIISGGRTYIDSAVIRNASIDTAHIKNSAITSAKIGNAQIDTLQIRGAAVTANERVSIWTGTVRGNQWATLATKRVSHPGSAGSGVIVMVSYTARSTGSTSDPEIYVYRNGSLIGAKGSAIGYQTAIFHAFSDPWPGANPHYEVRLRAADGGGERDGTIVQGGEVIFMSSKR